MTWDSLTYPEAVEVVRAYLDDRPTRRTVTSRDVVEGSDVCDDPASQQRIRMALDDLCTRVDTSGGRVRYERPDDDETQQ